MKYCTECLYSDTKPDLTFDENGVCSACLAFKAREGIDWSERANQFAELAKLLKESHSGPSPYHCIIPVSGGKDSHYQVIKAKEHGLNPLTVTAITDDMSYLGRSNLDNIPCLGVDNISVAVDARLRRTINRYTLETIGDISWAEHVTIFTIPVLEAVLRDIQFIIWGENPQNEYGGPNQTSQSMKMMNSTWLQEFGGLNGLRVEDIISAGLATKDQMYQYRMPPANRWPNSIFLGQFFPWDGLDNARIAAEHGFQESPFPVEVHGFTYENLDNYQTGIHDRFKYLKFGFGRATDICNNHIRRGRMSREDAVKHVRKYDGVMPMT